VLAVLSLRTGKNYVKEGLRYSWQQTVRVTEEKPNAYRLQLYLENLQCRNAGLFKSIPITKYLTPSRVDLGLTVQSLNKVLDVKEDNYSLTELLAGTAYSKPYADSTVSKTHPRITVSYSDFGFDEADMPDRVLGNALADIDTFFTSKEELAYIIAQANPDADFQDADSILIQAGRIEQFKNRFQIIKGIRVNKDLVGQGEHTDYERLLVETDSALMAATRASVLRQQGLDELLYKKGFQFYRFGKRTEARRYFGQALGYNPDHEASLGALVTIYLEQHQYDSAARMLIRHAQTFQGLANQRLVERAAKGLEKQSLSAGRQADPGSLRPVVGLMDSLCKSFPGYRCPDLSASAASGIVRADFQKLINNARGQASQNHYDEAEALAEQAFAFSKANALPSANEEAARYLLEQVRSRNVQMLTYQAKDAFKKGKDSLGLAEAHKAYLIAKKIGSKPELLGSVINAGVKDFITDWVNESIVQANKGNAQKSKTLRRVAYQAAVDFNFEEEPDIEAVFNNVKSVSLTPECNRKQTEFKKLLADGRAKSSANEFLAANTLFENAIALAKSDEECLISPAPARTELVRIIAPVHYLMGLARTSKFIQKSQFDSAYYAFQATRPLAPRLANSQKKIVTPFTRFVEQEGNPDFAAFAIKELTVKGEPDTALVVFRRLSTKQKGKGLIADAAATLAESLAQRDFKVQPRQDADRYLEQYFKGEKAPKPFDKAYRKKWKDLEQAL
jgi:tetratricopeptide (TPR) repeat protein